jgi:MarR family transcriptional regulator, organic hydroperoxide resistance regulator
MNEKQFLTKNYRLWILFNQTLAAMTQARIKQVGKYPFPSQAWALIFIWASKGRATPTSIAGYLYEERHSASELITKMEENGLVTKKPDPLLKNMVRISITPKGKEVCSHYMGAEVIDEFISGLTAEQQAQFETCLQIMLEKACRKLDIENLAVP